MLGKGGQKLGAVSTARAGCAVRVCFEPSMSTPKAHPSQVHTPLRAPLFHAVGVVLMVVFLEASPDSRVAAQSQPRHMMFFRCRVTEVSAVVLPICYGTKLD